MTTLFELQLDKHLRRKLILICLGVAVLVSVIYSVVAYRLSADLGTNTEIRYLEKRALIILAEVEEEADKAHQRISELVELIHRTEDIPQPIYISVTQGSVQWQINDLIWADRLYHLKNNILDSAKSGSSGHIVLENTHYIWTVQSDEDNEIRMLTASESIAKSLDYITKLLAITTIIVFWIAIWLALTLSSWIAKRVQDKNEALKKLATHDNLTGLPNRLFLVDFFQTQQKDKKLTERGAVLLVDLNHFKEINDTLGHAAGDRLLKAVATKLKATSEQGHQLIRSNGDEFLLWCPDADEQKSATIADKIISSFTLPEIINDLPIHTEVTIGIALMPDHSADIESLIIFADQAMHEAKQARQNWLVFDEENSTNVCSRQSLRYRSELSDALAERQIKLYYQPKVELASGKIASAEALARWHHPVDGVVPPISFIPLIEQSGSVREFGRYVLERAIEQIAVWQQQGIARPIAVNLSPYNLLDPQLVRFTKALLDKQGVAPNMLEIELTETATSMHLQTIATCLTAFKQIGVKLSIDDFGTGMSSLAYIGSLEVDTIKIDRSFIRDIEENDNHASIVSTAVNLARAFSCSVVAEGVENEEQAQLLKLLGCHYGQGYYYSRPVPEEQFTLMLQSTHTLPAP